MWGVCPLREHYLRLGRRAMRYEKPEVIDYGPIGDHTFDVPGVGDKGVCGYDPMFGEPSCHSD